MESRHLKYFLNRNILVYLKNGWTYRGILLEVDDTTARILDVKGVVLVNIDIIDRVIHRGEWEK